MKLALTDEFDCTGQTLLQIFFLIKLNRTIMNHRCLSASRVYFSLAHNVLYHFVENLIHLLVTYDDSVDLVFHKYFAQQ